MSQNDTVDVSRLVDDSGLNPLNVGLVIVGFFVVLVDGYDLVALGYAAPALIKAWNIPNKAALGPVFSASLFGMLAGAPLFGYVGDRLGRKAAIIGACLTLGVFTSAAALTTSLRPLLYLRLLTGFGLGGLIPTLIAITIEYAPRRMRATLVTIMYSGITFGAAVPGAVSAWLVPRFGWQVLFLFGGLFPLLMCGAVARFMPESIKYLIVSGRSQAKVSALAARLKPGLVINPGTRFVLPEEGNYRGFSPRYLFTGDLAAITPLLWLCYTAVLVSYFLLVSWMPTLLTAASVPAGKAAIATAIFQIGGMIGSLILSWLIDQRGLRIISLMFAMAVPAVALIGYVGGAEFLLIPVIFFAGFCVLSILTGLTVSTAMIYPTSIRANGSGWAIAIGRFGAMVGPMLGGWLIEMGLGFKEVLAVTASPIAVGFLASLLYTSLGSHRLRAQELAQAPAVSQALAE